MFHTDSTYITYRPRFAIKGVRYELLHHSRRRTASEGGGATVITIYGATGYTGRQIARTLLEAGRGVRLAGRTRDTLEELASELGSPEVRVASLEDDRALKALAEESSVMVNCAGPFVRTAQPVAEAAIAGRAHYVDISAEQLGTAWFYRDGDRPARAAGIALLPSFAFYPAPADVLAALICVGLGEIETVEVTYWISGWQPSVSTAEARLAGIRNEWLEHDDGAPRSRRRWPATRLFDFPAPIGRQRIAIYPTPDVLTIPRHTGARRVTTWQSAATLAPGPLGRFVPAVTNTASTLMRTSARGLVERVLTAGWQTSRPGEKTSDPTRFLVVVDAHGQLGQRRAWLRGEGIYDITSPIAVEAILRAADGRLRGTGTLAPAQVLDPMALLEKLTEHGASYELPADDLIVPCARPCAAPRPSR
jgi:short subunit dehydrogenase-like uncharacterized protein